jgi:dTDP-glucose 4,6-dehydratase
MRVLVTGGAGFIGSAVCRHFILNLGHEVVVLDKLTYAGNLNSLALVASDARYAFEQLDICDAVGLRTIFSKYRPQAVVHLAAESHVDRSISGSTVFIQTNVVGTFALLEASRAYLDENKQRSKEAFRFIHVSTDEVYGSLGEDDPASEHTRLLGFHHHARIPAETGIGLAYGRYCQPWSVWNRTVLPRLHWYMPL